MGARRPGATLEDVARSSLPLIYPDAFVRDNPEMMEDFIRRYMIAPTPAHAFFAQLEAAAAYDSFGRLPEIKAPALVLTGDSDELVPPENARILAGQHPLGQAHHLRGGGALLLLPVPPAGGRRRHRLPARQDLTWFQPDLPSVRIRNSNNGL